MRSTALLRSSKGSSQKAKLLIDQIRGRNVAEALAILDLSKKRLALTLRKVLWSAISNAEYRAEQSNVKLHMEKLFIEECVIQKGITKYRRRVRPAPMGRAYREQRRLFNVRLTLYDSGMSNE